MPPIIKWSTDEEAQNQTVQPTSSSSYTWRTTVGGIGANAPTGSNILYLYFDESGNLDFGDKGSNYFLLTCVVARRPFSTCNELMSLHYNCLEKGLDLERFHACDDNYNTRKEVYGVLTSHVSDYDAYVFHVDKKTISEDMQDPATLYAMTFSWLIERISEQAHLENCKQVIVITDTLPKEAKKKEVVKPLKDSLKRTFQNSGVPYILMHHSSQSDFNLQIADYVCWAAQRKISRDDEWPKKTIQEMFVSEGTIEEEDK